MAPLSPAAAKRRPTMLDVARLAGGVHPSTVSLVLRNSPNISDATRRRVLAAVRKIGYRRDPLLDAYNHHRMGVIPHKSEPVIACIADLGSREEAEKGEPHRSILRGARAAAENLHCKLELFLFGRGQLSAERLDGILHARGITSVLVLALRASTPDLALTWENFSAVRIESPALHFPRLSVANDHRQAARLAYRQLRLQGHRRIGLLLRPESSLADQDLLLAGHLLEQALDGEASPPPPLLLPAAAADGEEAAAALARRWINEHAIDAVVGDGPWLQRLLPPRQAPAFAALDVAGAPPALAGILPDHERVGSQAVEQLVSLMRANQRGSATTEACTYVPVRWRPGEAAPARRA